MATFTYYSGLGPTNSITAMIDEANLSLIYGDSSGGWYQDPDGMTLSFQGHSFMFQVGEFENSVYSGRLTALQLRDASNTLLFEVSLADTDARWLFDSLIAGTDLNTDPDAGDNRLWGNNNVVYGSEQPETLLTGGGNDWIFGGRGRDDIRSTGGNDTMEGGRGKDVFHATADGQVLITDFDDDGPLVNQDKIALSRYAYRHMDVMQIGPDTLLALYDRGTGVIGGTLMIEGYLADNLGRDDFLIL